MSAYAPATHHPSHITHHTMNHLISQYLSEFDGSPNTIKTYNETLKLFFRYLINNNLDASAPTRADVIKYKRHLQESGKSAMTVDNYMNSLKSFFRWADDRNYYENIASRIKSNAPKWQIRKHPITIQQVYDLINNIEPTSLINLRDRAIISVLYFCGLRVSEASSILIKDVSHKTLKIKGKGRTEKETVYLDEIASAHIQAYIKARKEAEYKLDPDSMLFLSYGPYQRNRLIKLEKNDLSKMVTRRMIQSGCKTDKVSAHSLRHSAAVHMIDSGADLYTVQLFLRHTDSNTSRIYTRYAEKSKIIADAPTKALESKYLTYASTRLGI